MDARNLKLQDDVKDLKSLGEHLDDILKFISFEVCDLPDDVLELLDNCVDIQSHAQIYDINLNFLREFYYLKKRDSIENQLTISQQLATLNKLKTLMKEADKDINLLERFMNTANKRVNSAPTVQRNIIQIEGKTKALQERQKGLNLPDDFNIESVIEKLSTLDQR